MALDDARSAWSGSNTVATSRLRAAVRSGLGGQRSASFTLSRDVCRFCGRTPAETRTPVGRDVIAYTCSRCLIVRNQGVGSGSQKSRAFSPESSTTSTTVFRHGRACKSGRPRVPIAEQRQKARERTRRYRQKSAAAATSGKPAAWRLAGGSGADRARRLSWRLR